MNYCRTALIASLWVVAITGCHHNPPPGTTTLVDGKKVVNIDKRLLEECPELIKLTDSTDEESIKVSKAWLNAYNTCRTNKSKLNAAVKDAFNLKEKK